MTISPPFQSQADGGPDTPTGSEKRAENEDQGATVAPFGTFALSPLKASCRNTALAFSNSHWAHWLSSGLSRIAGSRSAGPVDVTIFDTQNVRLYPADNLCEKRVFANPAGWDAKERAWLARAAETAEGEFVFLDVGANVGLYSLYADAALRKLSKKGRIIAVEPAPTCLGRLRDNVALSGATIEIVTTPLSDSCAAYHLVTNDKNIGETLISTDEEDPADPDHSTTTLTRLLAAADINKVDCLKIDIEGHELKVLSEFFANAEKAVWPRMIILEKAHDANSEVQKLCHDAGYQVLALSVLNAILIRTGDVLEGAA
ncbi:MAG: FkbM family methyltransferase [Parvularcula sp.]